MKAEEQELKQLLESRFPFVVVETAEEKRFLQLIESVATLAEMPLFTWSLIEGLRRNPRGEAVLETRALAADLMRMGCVFRMAPMTPEDVRKMFKEEVELYASRNPGHTVKGDSAAYELMIQHLVGLSRDDARRLIRQAVDGDGIINMEDVGRVLRHKHESLSRGGALQLAVLRAEEVASLRRWAEGRTVPAD